MIMKDTKISKSHNRLFRFLLTVYWERETKLHLGVLGTN